MCSVCLSQFQKRNVSTDFLKSLNGKATGLLNGLRQLLQQLFIAGVRRNVDAIETGVRLRQVVHVRVNEVDGEEARTSGASRALQSFESYKKVCQN